jgi:RimJ/RimL family protein N-acetyltransferase
VAAKEVKRILYKPEEWPRIAEFVASRAGGSPKMDNFTAIGLADDDKLIAGVVYTDFNGSQITAGIAIDGKCINREFLWFVHFYPFVQLGVKRITACVEQGNSASQQFVTRLGFKLESVMERAGRTGDLLVYRMFREDCRYLERPHARTTKKPSPTQ